jgi:hypothetical protein
MGGRRRRRDGSAAGCAAEQSRNMSDDVASGEEALRRGDPVSTASDASSSCGRHDCFAAIEHALQTCLNGIVRT